MSRHWGKDRNTIIKDLIRKYLPTLYPQAISGEPKIFEYPCTLLQHTQSCSFGDSQYTMAFQDIKKSYRDLSYLALLGLTWVFFFKVTVLIFLSPKWQNRTHYHNKDGDHTAHQSKNSGDLACFPLPSSSTLEMSLESLTTSASLFPKLYLKAGSHLIWISRLFSLPLASLFHNLSCSVIF